MSLQTAEKLRAVLAAVSSIARGAEEATAMNIRPDLVPYGGNGNITFIWGDEKMGLYHIGYRRGPEVVAQVIRAVLFGDVVRYVPTAKTLTLSHKGYDAFLSLDLHGKPKTWLLTGWKKNASDAIGQPLSKPNATQTSLTFSRTDLGADTLKILSEEVEKSKE
jgi:hypothetical protein